MNAQYRQEQAPYNHHVEHGAKQPAQQTEPNPFAVHGDPSRQAGTKSEEEAGSSRHVRWTRPTDLYSDPEFAKRAVRGVDLHAHLLRVVRNSPVKLARAARRRLAGPSYELRREPAAAPEGVELS
jgi:hypothetical protein